jgi:electron-transferring-flavoprotein dehydrogenase
MKEYEAAIHGSWIAEELKATRNFKGGFDKGLYAGLVHGGLISHVTKGREPWTLQHRTPDSQTT